MVEAAVNAEYFPLTIEYSSKWQADREGIDKAKLKGKETPPKLEEQKRGKQKRTY